VAHSWVSSATPPEQLGRALNRWPFGRRNYLAVRNLLRTDPAFWKPTFWGNLRLARQAQEKGAMQKLRELAPLISLLRRRSSTVIVEIGTARGGTFYAWCRAARPDAVLVSIDLPGGPFSGAEGARDVSELRQYGRDSQRLHFIRADSHQPQTLETLLEVLQGREIEFLFIDGDHTYEGVSRDFEMYAHLVRSGCPIAFHDILPHSQQQGCEVDRFWNQIKTGYRYTEFIDQDRAGLAKQYGGIGVLYWGRDRAPSRSE
jgi:predicted O-methyltransferase YrrM